MINVDIHTHTIASGHGSSATIADMAKAAKAAGISTLGISDHGPATPAAADESYFRSLKGSPRVRVGVRVLYGAEANILPGGGLDISDEVLAGLDYVIASMHRPPRTLICTGREDLDETDRMREINTADYIAAMKDPYVRIIGHPDNTQFPCDYEALTDAAAEEKVILEINDSSLQPDGYHHVDGINTAENYRVLADLCKWKQVPVLLSSDSHGTSRIGKVAEAEKLLQEISFPRELIANYNLSLLHAKD